MRRSRQATIDSRLRTMKRALKAGSALAGAEAWPDPNVAGEAANYTLLTANMTSLCRFVMLQKDTAARRELAYVGAAGTADNAALRNREEEEKKNHKAKAAELVQQASAMYNTDFLELCDSAVRHGGGGPPRRETSYRGVHYQQPYDSRYDEPHYEARRDRDRPQR